MYGQRPPTGSGANRPMSSSRARNEVTSPNGVKPLVSQTAARPQTGLKGAAQSGRLATSSIFL